MLTDISTSTLNVCSIYLLLYVQNYLISNFTRLKATGDKDPREDRIQSE